MINLKWTELKLKRPTRITIMTLSEGVVDLGLVKSTIAAKF